MIDVWRRALELDASGVPYALATVVRVDRPVSARPGDRALIGEDGRLEGWIGGSCAQPIVTREALAALADGASRLVRIRPPGAPAEPPAPGVVTEVTACASEGGLEVFVEPHPARPRLFVAGSSPAARALVGLAQTVGYRVTAVLDEPSEQLPGADDAVAIPALARARLRATDAVVVATMSRYDEEALEAALSTHAGYVGLVASAARGKHVLEMLRARGVSEEELTRVETPAGIDLGPSTQEEIALAVLARAVEARHRLESARAEVLCAPERTEVAIDPVCGMSVAVTPDAISLELAGVKYYFCHRACKDSFARQRA